MFPEPVVLRAFTVRCPPGPTLTLILVLTLTGLGDNEPVNGPTPSDLLKALTREPFILLQRGSAEADRETQNLGSPLTRFQRYQRLAVIKLGVGPSIVVRASTTVA